MQRGVADEVALPCGLVVANRFGKSAMTECMASPSTNAPNERHHTLYRRWAKGGAGLLLSGNIMIDSDSVSFLTSYTTNTHKHTLLEKLISDLRQGRYRESSRNIVVEDDRDLSELSTLAEAVHGEKEAGNGRSSLLIGQISHPGRHTPMSVAATPVAPSAVPAKTGGAPRFFNAPRELRGEEIPEIISRFVNAAVVLEKAGFDGVQVHGAHGYLLNQFLSPGANLRTDEWGGSAENRRRLFVEVVRAVKAHTSSSFAVGIKINSSDQYGLTAEDSAAAVLALEKEGIDFVEISGIVGPRKDGDEAKNEAFFFDYAQSLRKKTSLPFMLTGGFRSLAAMEDAVSSGVVDIIGQARPYCLEPDLPKHFIAKTITKNQEYDLSFGPSFAKRMTEPTLRNFYHQRLIHMMAAGKEPALTPGKLWCVTGMLFRSNVWDWSAKPVRNGLLLAAAVGALAFKSQS